ncbi:N-acetylmuramoyl-L-alanine amidase family protein [Paenibacillus macerans]|uniref:N-acetylmuramoyl-L-alanine amidase family protein n=1 Tax=Paenibacillus macerans TaxID=44252 RepID=UPI002DBCFAF8|nr:N-acetylmuramoyl-L-alanine amidase family protein [Paenibacillus macerans]MEC0329041.1 N-acetylmuramoyl-L-alanine amidase family protein [Paenibacillus macerans]MED4957210.1 N-acetylmuramoyl-L-alanine amidase family protein [Paenibacillus macerans]
MKKSILLFFLSLIFLIVLSPHEIDAKAAQSKIVLDGQEIALPENVEVANIDNNVLIPIRVVAENLKFKVKWDQKTQNVKIQNNSNAISLNVGQQEAEVSNEPVLLNTAPLMRNNTVLVPIRFVSEQMGLKVSWNNTDKTVYLTSNGEKAVLSEANTDDSLIHINEIHFSDHQLVASMDGQVTPTIFTLQDPERIVIDLPNTVFSDTFQSLNAGLNGKLDVSGSSQIADIRFSLFSQEPKQVRIVVELMENQEIPFNYEFNEGNLVVNLGLSENNSDLSDSGPVNPVNPANPVDPIDLVDPVDPVVKPGLKTVVIDAGHGGSDPGTTSFSNRHEKEFTLALALKVQELLLNEPGINLVMTRESDVYPTRSERVKLANELNADIFVSIHGNSVLSSPQTTGTETYYYERSSSKELANTIHKRLVEAVGFKDRGVKNGNFQVIRETKMAAVLLEVGFLSNPADEEAMFSDEMQYKAAQAIVDGIKEYLGSSRAGQHTS